MSLYIPLDSNDLITRTPIKKNQWKGKSFERVINKKARREIPKLQNMKALIIISIKDGTYWKEKKNKKKKKINIPFLERKESRRRETGHVSKQSFKKTHHKLINDNYLKSYKVIQNREKDNFFLLLWNPPDFALDETL